MNKKKRKKRKENSNNPDEVITASDLARAIAVALLIQNWNNIITFPFEYSFIVNDVDYLFIVHKRFSPIFTFLPCDLYLHKQSTECVYEMNTVTVMCTVRCTIALQPSGIIHFISSNRFLFNNNK